MKDKYPLVYIEWEDSLGCTSRWNPVDEEEPEITICYSVGWLVCDGKKLKVVAPHYFVGSNDAYAQSMGDMNIPVSAIRKLIKLKIPKK